MDSILGSGVSLEQFVVTLTEYFRNLLFLKSGLAKDTLLGSAPEDFDKTVLESLSAEQIEKAIELLLTLYRNIRFSLNQRFELELLLFRLTQLDQMISPSDIREALTLMRGELAAEPGARVVTSVQQGLTPQQGPAVDPGQVVKKVTEALRREKPALASALERVASVALEGEELALTFSAKDRFQGEVVLKDKEMLTARIASFLPRVSRIRLAFHETKVEPVKVDQRVELLRKVFRGEVVKGDADGDKSV